MILDSRSTFVACTYLTGNSAVFTSTASGEYVEEVVGCDSSLERLGIAEDQILNSHHTHDYAHELLSTAEHHHDGSAEKGLARFQIFTRQTRGNHFGEVRAPNSTKEESRSNAFHL